MIELWLVVSSVCFPCTINAKFNENCFQQVSISTSPPVVKQGETVYKVMEITPCKYKWIQFIEYQPGTRCDHNDPFCLNKENHGKQKCTLCWKLYRKTTEEKWVIDD